MNLFCQIQNSGALSDGEGFLGWKSLVGFFGVDPNYIQHLKYFGTKLLQSKFGFTRYRDNFNFFSNKAFQLFNFLRSVWNVRLVGYDNGRSIHCALEDGVFNIIYCGFALNLNSGIEYSIAFEKSLHVF